jgi:hypothetical protein
MAGTQNGRVDLTFVFWRIGVAAREGI